MIGLVAALGVLAAVSYTPNLAVVSICVGLLPITIWVPVRWISLDAARPPQALVCGFLSGILNEQADEVVGVYAGAGIGLVHREEIGEWTTLTLRKSS